jgi:hypothetical protein
MGARRSATAITTVVCGVLIAGCSGSSGGGPSGAIPSRSTGSVSASASASASTSATGGEPGAAAPGAVTGAVTAAYDAFFSSRSTWRQSQAVLQNGARFHDALVAQGKSQYASTSTARVRSVRLLSPNVASVSYDILSNGQPLLQDVHGHAVRQNGKWVVAAETFCGLLKLQGQAPHACSDPSVTALPS